MFHTISLSATLAITWLLLSGYFTPLMLGLGAGSIIFVVLVVHRMDHADHETHPIHMVGKAFTYFPWLMLEIIKANLDVAKTILQRDMIIETKVIQVDGSQRTDVGLVAYANSITLTPGTVTIWDNGTKLDVHSLTPVAAQGLLSGEMDKRVTELEAAGAWEDGDDS